MRLRAKGDGLIALARPALLEQRLEAQHPGEHRRFLVRRGKIDSLSQCLRLLDSLV